MITVLLSLLAFLVGALLVVSVTRQMDMTDRLIRETIEKLIKNGEELNDRNVAVNRSEEV